MTATASSTRSIEIVRNFTEDVFNGRDYDALQELQSSDYVQHGPMTGQEIEGYGPSLESLQVFHTAFSDLTATEEFAFSDDDLVCTRYTYTGTHDGEFMGLAPTGVEVEVPGTVINRVEDGKITETWATVDFLGLFQQLGIVPEFEELAA